MTKQLAIAGGDLFRIAAAQMGDARQWWRLAQVNGLQDPILTGVQQIIIPVSNPALIDGLPPQ